MSYPIAQDLLAKTLLGISASEAEAQGICVACRQPTSTDTEIYKTYAFCPECWGKVVQPPTEKLNLDTIPFHEFYKD